MKRIILAFSLLCLMPAHADRWLLLPPRIEPAAEQASLAAADAGTIARAMALYLRVSRLSHVVSVQEAEACLRHENLSMQNKIDPEVLGRIARQCQAERMLLTRIRRRQGALEVTTKVFFRESNQLTDTMSLTGADLNRVLGEHLSERFSLRPATPKENSRDLIVAGDTFGASYHDWQQMRGHLLSLDATKTAYCLVDTNGRLQSYRLRADKTQEKDFLERLRFEAGSALTGSQEISKCVRSAQDQSLSEGRRAVILFLVSAEPQDSTQRIQLKAALRSLAGRGKLLLVPASAASETTTRFWAQLARELGDSASYLPSAQRARVGLANGQEWYVFRRTGRLYESRDEEPRRLERGIIIPDRFSSENAPADLLKVYAALSGNKIVSPGETVIWNAPLITSLRQAFQAPGRDAASWRVMLEQNGVTYYLSLAPAEARRLKVGEFARIYTELLPATSRDSLRNRPSPVIVIDRAEDSAPGLEISIADFLKKPSRYLRQGLGGRSFWVMTGKVLQVFPPEADALDDGF